MGTMYDAVNASAIPSDAEIVAGYDDGHYVWSHSDWARFPNARHVHIAVNPATRGADMIDTEPGNWEPEQAAHSDAPGCYTMGSWWDRARAAYNALGKTPDYWIADWDGDPHVPAGAVAKQFADGSMLGAGYDKSVTVDGWPRGSGSTPAPSVPPSSGDTYTVVSGDTLSGIGARLGVDWHDIATCNGISAPYTIYPGQVLDIPAGHVPATSGGASATYTVASGDTLSEIGARLGVPWRTIASVNGIAAPYTIYPGQTLTVPGKNAHGGGGQQVYVVQSGDTLSGIGARLDVDWHHLADINGITDPDVIHPGEKIHY